MGLFETFWELDSIRNFYDVSSKITYSFMYKMTTASFYLSNIESYSRYVTTETITQRFPHMVIAIQEVSDLNIRTFTPV